MAQCCCHDTGAYSDRERVGSEHIIDGRPLLFLWWFFRYLL
jgi:hypothetical protein